MSEATKVPLLDLSAQYEQIRGEIDEAIREVVESQRFVLGPEVGHLEEEIAAYCRTRHAVGCASGSDALLLALMACGVGPGDQVICPAYTFFATASSIARLGAEPVFADIDPVTYNINPQTVRRAAGGTRGLRGIIPVHLYGQIVDMEAFVEIGEEFEVPVIEDAAQAIGSRDGAGRPAGSCGNIGCFSFYPSKNLGGFGDGGILTTGDDELEKRLRMLRVHGERRKYHHDLIGINSRLDALQAAVLRVKLRHLDGWTAARRANAAHYDAAFAAAGAESSAAPLSGDGLPLRTPHRAGGAASHIYNQYVIRVPAALRDPLREHLAKRGVGTEIYYPVPLHLQPCFKDLGYEPGALPESEAAANETIALPIYPELTREQLDHVVGSVLEFVGEPIPK